MYRSYDEWKSDDRFQEAEIYRECRECYAKPQTYFEEIEGICVRCQKLLDMIAAEDDCA